MTKELKSKKSLARFNFIQEWTGEILSQCGLSIENINPVDKAYAKLAINQIMDAAIYHRAILMPVLPNYPKINNRLIFITWWSETVIIQVGKNIEDMDQKTKRAVLNSVKRCMDDAISKSKILDCDFDEGYRFKSPNQALVADGLAVIQFDNHTEVMLSQPQGVN